MSPSRKNNPSLPKRNLQLHIPDPASRRAVPLRRKLVLSDARIALAAATAPAYCSIAPPAHADEIAPPCPGLKEPHLVRHGEGLNSVVRRILFVAARASISHVTYTFEIRALHNVTSVTLRTLSISQSRHVPIP